MKIKRIISLLSAIMLLVTVSNTALADTITVEDIEEPSYEDTYTEDISVQDEIISETIAQDPVEACITLVDMIDSDNPTLESVGAAKEAFDSLTMAQKLKVSNSDKLYYAESVVYSDNPQAGDNGINSDTPDGVSEKNGYKYTFNGADAVNTKINIYFISDDDNDGKADIPVLSLVDSLNRTISLGDNITEIKNSLLSMTIIKDASHAELSIGDITEGTWTVKSSSRVTFEMSEGSTAQKTTDFGSEETIEAETTESTEVHLNISRLIILVLVLILPFAGILILKLRKKKENKEEPEPVEIKKISAEEEINKLEKQNAEMFTVPADRNIPEPEYDDRFAYTQYDAEYDIEKDETIEEIEFAPSEKEEENENSSEKNNDEFMKWFTDF